MRRKAPENRFGVGTVITVAVLGFVFLAIWKPWQPKDPESGQPHRTLRKLEIHIPAPKKESTYDLEVAISPDGRKLAYVDGEGLWVKPLDRVAPPILLSASERINRSGYLFWSPTSAEIGYFEGATIYRVSINGGQPVAICSPKHHTGAGLWLPDGKLLFPVSGAEATNGIYEVSANGGQPKIKVPARDNDQLVPAGMLPEGRGVLLLCFKNKKFGATVEVLTPDNQRKVIFEEPGLLVTKAIFSSPGHIIYTRRDQVGGLWAFRFSLSRLERTGEPFRIDTQGGSPSVAADGTLVFIPRDPDRGGLTQLVWVDVEAKIIGKVGDPIKRLVDAWLSPDGRRIVVWTAGAAEDRIWMLDVARGTLLPLTENSVRALRPKWMPDSQRVLFDRWLWQGEADFAVVLKSVDGLSEEKEVFRGYGLSLSRDGKHLVLTPGDKTYQVVTLDGSAPPVALPAQLNDADSFSLSPDSLLMAYQTRDEGQESLYLTTVPEFGHRTLIARTRDLRAAWSPSGKELFFVDAASRAMMSVPVKREGGAIEVGQATKLFEVPANCLDSDGSAGPFSVTSDGKRFLMQQELRDGADKTGTRPNTVVLVENWFEEFREKK